MKSKNLLLVILAIMLVFAMTAVGCGDDSTDNNNNNNNGGGDTVVTFNSVTANGSATQTTTALTLTFSQAITGLSANDISLSGVSGVNKGTISNSGATYTMPISGFTAGGTLNVAVSKSGYTISGSPKTVTIYYYSGSSGGGSGSWTAIDVSNIFSSILAIAYGNNKFVAGGGFNTPMAISPDGVIWTATNVSNISVVRAIAYGNNKFVAVGDGGKMATSSDGTTWTAVDVSSIFGTGGSGSTGTIKAITYGNDKFVAGGASGRMAYSSDGTTWTAVAKSPFITYNSSGTVAISEIGINGIAYGNNKFVAVGDWYGKMATSTDGVTWTSIANSTFSTENTSSSRINAIAYGNDKFVAVGNGGKMATSSNGTTWTAVDVSSIFGSSIDKIINAIAYGNNKFFAGASYSTYENVNKIATSMDGVTWTADSTFPPAIQTSNTNVNNIHAIAYGNGKFIASINPSSRIAYLSDN